MELFRLFGSVLIDDKDAIQSLRNVDNKGKSTGQKFADVAKKGLAIGAAVVGAGVAAGGALLGMAKKSAETTDRIDKLSQKIGLSREGFQEWDYIMSQSGMSVEQLQTGLKTMVNAVDQAVEGTGKGAESFDKLGISVLDASGNVKDQETIFNEAVIALQGMEEGTEKAKLANDLFGRSGSEMMPLLNGAAGSVEEMKQQAHDLGLVLGDETIDAGVKFTDSMDQVQRMLGVVGTKVGAEVMPIVQSFLEWVVLHMPEIQAFISNAFGVFSTVVTTLVDGFNTYLLPSLSTFYEWAVANLPVIKQFVSDTFTTMKEKINQAKEAVNKITEFIQKHWTVFEPILAGIAGAIAVYGAIAIAMGLWSAATTVWAAVTTIATTIAGGFATAVAFLTSPIGLVVLAIGAAIAIGVALYRNWETISSKAGELWGVIKTKFNDIKDAIMTPINSAKTAVSDAIEAMKGFFNFQWKLPSIKMPSFSVSGSANPLNWLKEGVPRLSVNWNAMGGIFDKPTIFNTSQGLQGVGEAGPEAIMPLSKLESMLNLKEQGNEVNVNVTIENFNNNNDDDVNKLAEKLAFETNRRLTGGGLSYA